MDGDITHPKNHICGSIETRIKLENGPIPH